jgi:H+/Cl- antiporter ClcA
VRWTLLAAASGVLAGLASAAFLAGLDWATQTRLEHPALVWFLPVAGLAIGLLYHRYGGRAAEGSGLLLDELHQPRAWVPRRMAPMVAGGSVVSHLFGASVGREGTALQMSGSLTDLLARRLSLGPRDRRTLLVAALAAGFGGMFGLPWAGAVFGLEVQAIRPTRAEMLRRARRRAAARSRRETADEPPVGGVTFAAGRAGARALDVARRWRPYGVMVLPVVVASATANALVRLLQHHEESPPHLSPHLGPALAGKLVAVGLLCAAMAALFIGATDLIRSGTRQIATWPPLRPVLGGVVVVLLTTVVGRDYLGLSLPLANQALIGHDTSWSVPLLKIAFTAICLGSGFVGGEVTPLFVIGATTGAAASPALGLDPMVGAAVGFVTVFASAANTPVACTVMAVELFGWGMVAPVAIATTMAFVASGHRGIYPSQRVVTERGTVPRSQASWVRRRSAPT